METLGHIAKSLTIGALDALQAVLSIVQTIHMTGGVSIYTVTHRDFNGYDLRSANLSNNFGNGRSLRVDKSQIKSTNAYVYNDNGELDSPVIYSDYIGRLYHQDDFIESSSFGFITEEGFGKFERAIMNKNLNNVIAKNEDYSNAMPTDYSAPFLGEDFRRTVDPMAIGDEYSVEEREHMIFHDELRKSRKHFSDKMMENTKYVDSKIGATKERERYAGLQPSNLISSNGEEIDISLGYTGRTYDSELTKDIKKFGSDYFQNYLSKYRINYNYIEKFPPYDGVKVNGRSYMEYVDIPDMISDLSYLRGKPIKILDYSSSFRERNFNESFFYKYNNPYAVGNSSDIINVYSVAKRPIGEYKEIKIESGKGDSKNLLTKSTYTELESLNDSTSGKRGNFIGETGYSKLIHRTNNLFKNMKLGTLVNRFHTSSIDLHDYDNDELVTSKSRYGLSRGRNLLSTEEKTTNGYSNPYCRVWTAHHQYTKLSRLIRPFTTDEKTMSVSETQGFIENDTNLRPGNGGTVHLGNHTVLMDNGYVRMSPAHDDGSRDIKNFMFSIENLAWRDVNWDSARVTKEQQGPNGGRMMWFPPYNLKFSENVNVEWNANKFIGRGEQIYTYTNTDRSGTLSFTLLIDHPSIINKWRGTSLTVDDAEERENEILRFFAGCGMLDGSVSAGNDKGRDDNEDNFDITSKDPVYNGRTRNVALILFFPNNFSGYDYKGDLSSAIDMLRGYECGSSWSDEQDSDLVNTVYPNNNSANLFDLNTIKSNGDSEDECIGYVRDMLFGGDMDVEFRGFFDNEWGYDNLNNVIKNMNTEDGEIFGDKHKNISIEKIELYGFASSHGTEENNKKLTQRRADFIKNAVISKCKEITPEMFNEAKTEIKEVTDVSTNPIERDINMITAKVGRAAYVLFRVKWDEEATTNSIIEENTFVVQNQNYDSVPAEVETEPVPEEATVVTESIEEDTYRADNEYLYFANLERDDEVAYQRIIDRIRYFNPAYHSITPEGFNARLTFLHQCTRQGPTVDLSSGRHSASGSTNYTKYAGNLSFGRAPYCILRIGDFFHTKICITSLSIDYDGGGGIQWDLNPEGVGVQPMFANVNINFNFIGGQDLKGPIERLQNAVTSNYYANASVYDHKADKKGSGFPYDVRLNVPDKNPREDELAPPAPSSEFSKTVPQTPEQKFDDLNLGRYTWFK